MKRILIAASSLALLLPALAEAQAPAQLPTTKPAPGGRPPGGGGGNRPPNNGGNRPPNNGGNRPPNNGGNRPPNYRPPYNGGGHGNRFSYNGHYYNRYHGPAYRYPPGYGYRRWAYGQILPFTFLSSAYFFSNYAAIGLGPPPYGYQWVRYGPDLLLVNVRTGRITQVIPGAIY
jgi:Ni/Co efflux regulator RcnB